MSESELYEDYSTYESELIVECDHCDADITFGVSACHGCAVVFDTEYWRERYINEGIGHWLSNDDGLIDEYNLIQPTDLPELYHDGIMVCCNQDYHDCECDFPVFWHDFKDVDKASYEAAYTINNPCSACEYFYEKECLPLRQWLVDYLRAGHKFPGSIDSPCDNFLHWKEAQLRKANQETPVDIF